jgi:AbrB family looped-hinge helix DNA binding protein
MDNTMHSIPMDAAGRVVLPSAIRRRLNLHAGDQFDLEVGADQLTLKVVRSHPSGLVMNNGRLVWDVPGTTPDLADFDEALARGRESRDRRADGIAEADA